MRNKFFHLLIYFLLCLFVLLTSKSFAQKENEDIKQAQIYLQSGNYLEAREILRPFLDQPSLFNEEIISAYFETFLERGEYQEGLTAVESFLIKTPDNPFLLHMKGRLLVSVGKYQEALFNFQKAYDLKNDYLRNLLEIGELAELTGKRNQAYRIYSQIVILNQQNKYQAADLLAITARAFAKLEDFHKANQYFRTAHQVDPNNIQNLYWWASLFLEKYNNADALRTFEEALALNPNKADLILGYAHATESFSQMEILAQKALEANPNSVDALNMLTEVLIIDGDFNKANQLLDKALKINPIDIYTLANLATIQFLQEEKENFAKTEQIVQNINPFCSEFYWMIAENCTRKVRYRDAVDFCYTAISKDRQNWKAYALLGSNLLRIGDISKAKIYLERGFKGDPFNLFARNTLELIDEYQNFTTLTSEHFNLFIHKSESAILGEPILQFAEECYDSLSRRYSYSAQNKIQLEAYNDHDDFAVRISGLPGIGLLGVCFGDVVAFDTPKAQVTPEYNWAQTMWHEIGHVMALGMSNNKVPRWFTEGLSVYEEMLARPQWGRKMELKLFQAMEEGLLLPLSEINKGFTRPQFPEQVILTYYQSSKYIEFLVKRFGFSAITDILQEFAKGKNSNEAFQTVLALDLGQVEELLSQDFLNQKESFRDILVDLPSMTSKGKDKEDEVKNVSEGSKNPLFKNLHAGYKLLKEKKFSEAEQHFLEAIKHFPNYTGAGNAYEGLAEIYRINKDQKKLQNILIKYLRITEYGVVEAKELGQIFQEQDDIKNAIKYYLQSIQVDPYDLNIHLSLAELYSQQKAYHSEIRERQAVLALDPVDKSDAQFQLAQSLLNNGQKSQAKRAVLMALEIAPGFREAQKLLLKCTDNLP